MILSLTAWTMPLTELDIDSIADKPATREKSRVPAFFENPIP